VVAGAVGWTAGGFGADGSGRRAAGRSWEGGFEAPPTSWRKPATASSRAVGLGVQVPGWRGRSLRRWPRCSGHLVHLADGRIHLFNPLALFAGSRRDLGDQLIDLLNLAHDSANPCCTER